MLAPVVREGLGSYAIGERVRSLRLRRRLGLVELGKHTGLSPALLSKIERDRNFPTLPTLLRIAMVFGVGLEHFFIDPKKKHVAAVVRRRERRRLPERADGGPSSYEFESLDFRANDRKLSGYLAFFRDLPLSKIKPHSHPGAELLFVLRGRLSVRILEESHALGTGDSLYFDAGVAHSYRKEGRGPCEALVVTTG
jgi:transcriptional regulator with XRE-family HTH domain